RLPASGVRAGGSRAPLGGAGALRGRPDGLCPQPWHLKLRLRRSRHETNPHGPRARCKASPRVAIGTLMREGYASRTAEQNALFRALEFFRPAHQRICDDPLARHFLTWPLTLVAHVAAIPGTARFVSSFIDRRWPGVRSSVVARTRLIDDAIAAALENDLEQLVIL